MRLAGFPTAILFASLLCAATFADAQLTTDVTRQQRALGRRSLAQDTSFVGSPPTGGPSALGQALTTLAAEKQGQQVNLEEVANPPLPPGNLTSPPPPGGIGTQNVILAAQELPFTAPSSDLQQPLANITTGQPSPPPPTTAGTGQASPSPPPVNQDVAAGPPASPSPAGGLPLGTPSSPSPPGGFPSGSPSSPSPPGLPSSPSPPVVEGPGALPSSSSSSPPPGAGGLPILPPTGSQPGGAGSPPVVAPPSIPITPPAAAPPINPIIPPAVVPPVVPPPIIPNTTATPGPPGTAALTAVTYTTNAQQAPAASDYGSYAQQQLASSTPNYQQLTSAVTSAILAVGNTNHPIPGGSARGYPGSLDFLTPDQLREYADSAIDCAARYLPNTLSLSDRIALLIADINAESSFNPGGIASNGQYGNSVGPMQVTPSIWVGLYQQYGDGQAFNPYTIWGNMHIASWAIQQIGKTGGGGFTNYGHGTKPKSWNTGLYYWSGQSQVSPDQNWVPQTQYHNNQCGDLQMMGISCDILDATWT